MFSPDERGRYAGLADVLRHHDYFMVCADFDAYYAAQRNLDETWDHPERWAKSAILNTAKTGWFSSDRAIEEYATEIWKAPFKADA